MAIKYVHTNIISDDWAALARFYQLVFDCEPVPPARDLQGDWLEAGTGVEGAHLEGMHLRLPGHGADGPTLEIFQYHHNAPGPPTPAANRRGYGHLAFLVDDVSALREAVLAHGGADLGRVVSSQVPGVGTLTFTYMTDPEGNILEIQSWG